MEGGKFIKVLYFIALLTLLIGIISIIVTLVVFFKSRSKEFEFDNLRYTKRIKSKINKFKALSILIFKIFKFL